MSFRVALMLLLCSTFPLNLFASDLCSRDNMLASEARAKRACFKRWQRELPYRLKLNKRDALHFKRNGFFRPYQFSSPSVQDNMLYLGLDNSQVHAASLKPFKKIWHSATKGPVQAKLSVADGKVYFGDSKGFAYALNASDGSEVWQIKLDDAVMSEPLIKDGKIFFLTLSGRLYALDAKTGSELWHSGSSEKNWGFSVHKVSAPQAWQDLILVGTASGMVQAFASSRGSLVWSRQLGDLQADISDVDAKIWVGSDRLYATSADGKLARLDPSSGSIIWTSDIGGANDLFIKGDRLYITANNIFAALDAESGMHLWEQEIEEATGLSAPVVGENFAAVASTNDALYFFLPDSGDLLLRRYIKKGSFGDPALLGNDLYVFTNSSDLIAFQVKLKPIKKKKVKAN